jgi:hypothetical protein
VRTKVIGQTSRVISISATGEGSFVSDVFCSPATVVCDVMLSIIDFS